MEFKLLDVVVLNSDVPEHGLRKGDLGTIVELYEPDGLDVEFMTAAGMTQAVLTLRRRDVRRPADTDMRAVRSLNPADEDQQIEQS